MTAEITLTVAGIDTGPFDLYSNMDFYTVPFAAGISKAVLQSGFTSTTVPDYTTIVRVKSTGVCVNYTDINLVPFSPTTTTTTTPPPTTSTTTSTTTLVPEVPCNSNVTAGGPGVTESFVNLSPLGGLIVFAFDAVGVPDKLEIIHNGVKKATSSMTTPNEGPFDNLYGNPTVPTEPETSTVVQFIGGSKGAIPNRQATFNSETGSPLIIPGGYQQLVWWQYTPADYLINTIVTVRVTGPAGTAWNLQRMCDPTTTTTTTTV